MRRVVPPCCLLVQIGQPDGPGAFVSLVSFDLFVSATADVRWLLRSERWADQTSRLRLPSSRRRANPHAAAAERPTACASLDRARRATPHIAERTTTARDAPPRPSLRYGAGGWILDLETGADASIAAVQQLRNRGYVDRQTRAVFVDVALYNPGVDLFTSVHLTFEFLPGGALVRTGETDSQPLLADLRALAGDDGYSRRQQAQVVIELLSYLAIVGYFLLRAADEVVGYAGFLTYLSSGWNALDALSILCLLAVIVIMCHVRIVSLNHWN